jgi:hypothetical protein
MLKECSRRNLNEMINPLMHEENPLYKKIKKIKEAYPDLCEDAIYVRQGSAHTTKFSSSSKYIREYRDSAGKEDF